MIYPKHTRKLGDTLMPMNRVLRLNGNPIELSGYTVEALMKDISGNVVLAATSTGVTAQPTQTFTAATTDIITCNGHGVIDGDQVVLSNSGGALPAGLSASTRYYATDITPNTFKLLAIPTGGAVDITGTGTGTHSFYIVGSVQYDFSSLTVDEAGQFKFWFVLSSGGEYFHVPDNGEIPVEIQAVA